MFSAKQREIPLPTMTANLSSVPEQISELASLFPASVALRQGDSEWKYETLDRKADQFAGYLATLGAGPGTTVAICMERCFDWIAAALGIMRAGAAYVPLDSSWPDARLRYAIDDSGAVALVARTTLLARLQGGLHGIDPCRDVAAIAAAPEIPPHALDPGEIAYLIYTSGSSGTPKGVEITHANLSHLAAWHCEAFAVSRHDRASHLAGLGFDAAVWEIWPHLCAGATLCLADDAIRSSPELIQDWMLKERVTVGFVPTVHAAPLLSMEWPSTTALRFLLTGGDALPRGPEAGLPFQVVNNYGPTECTVVATSGVLKAGAAGRPAIGEAILGVVVYLLDEECKPVADGETGEIYIGGAGVGRGYRNLPESTERAFLPDPFAKRPGARMYRTGDRASKRPDGQIEFRGRLDRQTKIRGHRVELDEISNVLADHPGVRFATVAASVSVAGENHLLAYVLLNENRDHPTERQLQDHLLHRLPNWMVPSTFVRLQSIPVSPNGKLDLALLPPPSAANVMDDQDHGRPASPVAEQLLAIVRDVLESDRVTAADNFFLAGGHSLLGMQLVMRVSKAFGVDLSLQQLFEAPTVERLARVVSTKSDEKRLAAIWADLLGRNHIDADSNFFELGGSPDQINELGSRIFAQTGRRVAADLLRANPTVGLQARLVNEPCDDAPDLPPGVLALQPHGTRNTIFWVHHLLANLAKAVGGDQPLLSVALAEEDVAALGKRPSFEAIAARLVSKILTTRPSGPYTIGGFCLGGILAFEIASQLRAAGHEVPLLVLLDPPDPLFLESRDTLTPRLSDPRYALRRAARLGPRSILFKLRERVLKQFGQSEAGKFGATGVRGVREMIETAAFAYRPGKYEGKVVLLLAADHPPHVNFLPGWQAVISRDLHAQYVDAHHSDLTDAENLRTVVDAIAPYLYPAGRDAAPPLARAAAGTPAGK